MSPETKFFIGIGIAIGSIFGIFILEKRYIHQIKLYNLIGKECQKVMHVMEVDPALDNKLVIISGKVATNNEIVQDQSIYTV